MEGETMELQETLEGIAGDRRRFLLFRIAGLDKNTALVAIDVPEKRYNTWLHNARFVEAHRKIKELHETNREQAMRLIRRDNQMVATLLERDVVERLREELDTGDYKLVKTNLGKAVYERLMNELDKAPTIQHNTWEQRILAIQNQHQLEEGDTIDGYISEATASSPEEYQESSHEQESAQES